MKFYSAYRDRVSDLAQIIRNLENLLGIFRTLDNALQNRQARNDEDELLQGIDDSILTCHEFIKELQTESQKFQEEPNKTLIGRFQASGRKVTYPFRKSTLLKLEEDIGEIRNNLSLALDVLQLKSNNELEEGILEIKSLVRRIDSIHISSTICGWLMAPDATSNHHVACEKRHSDTGQWFVDGQHFQNWLVERNSFHWINGFAGCGKSVLCSTAIQSTFHHCQHRDGLGIAFFYFSFNDESKITASGMLRALLLQLSAQLEDGEKDLQQLHAAQISGTPPVGALLNSLRNIIGRFQDSYILLDALDESPRERKREDVLGAIEIMRQWRLPGLHILVTSRDELDIRQSLRPAYNEETTMRNCETNKDITSFVSYQINHDSKFQRWKARHEEIEDKLMEKSQGVFRYAECQLNTLKRVRNQNQLDVCLRSLPRDLDETYERILCDIDETYAEDVRRILTVICVSKRPLTVEELIDAHAVDLGEPPHLDREGRAYEPQDLIDICLGLIDTVVTQGNKGEKSSVVRIAHFSVQEYLVSGRMLQQKAMRFAVRTELANIEMAQICLVYLFEPKLSNIPPDETMLIDFPFAHFAAMHWFSHFTEGSGTGSNAEGLILRLFSGYKAFRAWVQLHDLETPWITDVDFDRKYIPSPVYYAALLGLDSVLNSLIKSWAEGTRISDSINDQGGRNRNALQAASYQGYKKIVQILLDHGAEVNAQGGRYGNALHAASYGGHQTVVEILLNHGADVNAPGGRRYRNTLQAAWYQGHEKIVLILLEHGAEAKPEGREYENTL